MREANESQFRFRYEEARPPSDISHLAFCFFEFSVLGKGCDLIPHEIQPDGFISVLIRKKIKPASPPILLIRGLSLDTFTASVSPGDVHWGFRVSPAANRLVFRCDPNKIPTQPLIRPSILPHISTELEPVLARIGSFKEAQVVFRSLFNCLEIPREERDPAVSQAVDNLIASNGTAKISEVVDDLGVNRRGLERRFRKDVGMTLKQYARVFRLRSTAISLIEEDNLNWANRAAEMGFADQSHLIREFIALTGRTPRGFSSNVEETDFKGLVS